jgi:hypothetical protein
MTARSNHLKVLAFALTAIVAVCLLALVAAKMPAEAPFLAVVSGNQLVFPSHRVEQLVNPVVGKAAPELYVMSAHSTERTNPTNKYGMDNHTVVVAQWHKDFLHLRKVSQQ